MSLKNKLMPSYRLGGITAWGQDRLDLLDASLEVR